MHRIERPVEPHSLTEYRLAHPQERDWKAFRDTGAYKDAKTQLASNQGCLCAYCECQLRSSDQTRIEHVHPKSDPDPEHNWTLDWSNMVAVCMGGAKPGIDPKNHHCDAIKEDSKEPILNPYLMTDECLFRLDENHGLQPARGLAADLNELVVQTVETLNLNCQELCNKRRAVRTEFERKRKTLEQGNPLQESVRTKIAQDWFGAGRKPSFFTTRRILLGRFAEKALHG